MLHKDANPYSRGRAAPRRRDRARAPAGGDGRRHHARRRVRARQGPRGRLRRRRPRPRPAGVARRRRLPPPLHRRARDQGPHAHGRRLDRRPRRRPGARRRRLPAQAVPLARARRADPRARAPRRPGPAADPPPRRRRARPRPPRGAAGRAVARPHAEGVRRPRGPARGRRPGGLDRGAARARLGRERRPVHEHGPDVRHDPEAQARRPARDQDRDGRRLPGVMRRPRPTVRLKMTLLYAGVFFVAGALLLSVSYVLVRNSLMNPGNIRNLPADNWDYNVTAQHEIATDALSHLRTQYAMALAAMTGLSVLLGWAMAGRVLRPLQRITATAKRVSQDNLDERIGLEGPRDELKELADTFDGMLERLSGAFASQRRFVANASHELRTPLTVIRTELEVTLSDPRATTAELRAMGETVRDATLDTERLIQALLTLARWEGGNARHDPLDLADAARRALAQTASEAAARGLDMRPTLHPPPPPPPHRHAPDARPRARARRPAAARAPRRQPRRERRAPQPRWRLRRDPHRPGRRPLHRRGAQRRRRDPDRDARLAARAVPAPGPRGARRRRRPRPVDRALGRRGARRLRRAPRPPVRRPRRARVAARARRRHS